MLVSPCRLRAPGVNDDDPAAALYDRVQSFLEPGLADQRPLGDQRISADQDGERGPPQIRPRQERDIIVEEMAGHKAGRGVFRIYIIGKARAERILQHRKEHQSGHAVIGWIPALHRDHFGPMALPNVVKASRYVRKRSEGHKSDTQTLMRISYAVFCLKKKKM